MLIILAPLFSLIALAAGGIATAVGMILNGPRSMRKKADPPLVVLPPVPTPAMLRQIEDEERERAAALAR